MGKIAAIDFGLKRIGIAISDQTKKMALPLMTVSGGLNAVVAALTPRKSEIETILIGLPLLMNGQKSEMAALVESFAKDLEKALQIPIVLIDERLSSKQAETHLREANYRRKERAKHLDQVAATLLLESYLHTLKVSQTRSL